MTYTPGQIDHINRTLPLIFSPKKLGNKMFSIRKSGYTEIEARGYTKLRSDGYSKIAMLEIRSVLPTSSTSTFNTFELYQITYSAELKRFVINILYDGDKGEESYMEIYVITPTDPALSLKYNRLADMMYNGLQLSHEICLFDQYRSAMQSIVDSQCDAIFDIIDARVADHENQTSRQMSSQKECSHNCDQNHFDATYAGASETDQMPKDNAEEEQIIRTKVDDRAETVSQTNFVSRTGTAPRTSYGSADLDMFDHLGYRPRGSSEESAKTTDPTETS